MSDIVKYGYLVGGGEKTMVEDRQMTVYIGK